MRVYSSCFLYINVLYSSLRECGAFSILPSKCSFQSQRRNIMLKASSTVSDVSVRESQVSKLKRVLAREYTSFFDPMETKYYAPDVTFDDPLTSLEGAGSYQKNVDMLAGRTLMGSVLFENAKINLHSVTGGEVKEDGEIDNILTRWTLKLTVKVLPWSPTAVFTGVSVYKVASIDSEVTVVGQTDYWDSINLLPNSGGEYAKVDKSIALNDFLDQLKPGGLQAQQSAAEIPYELLRRGKDYEVRRYPETIFVQIPYSRRDEGYDLLGSVTRGMRQFAPAVMSVGDSKKMGWFVGYALPGQELKLPKDFEGRGGAKIMTEPSKIIAIGRFNDAALEPVVRKSHADLKNALERDGLSFEDDGTVKFAQYDAIYSMGSRRGECWIELNSDGCPW